MGAPEITVVVPTYRRADHALRVIDALEAQTLHPDRFEVVLVENASGDGTYERLAERAAASPLELRVLETEVNRGPAPARNLGLREARAELVAFTDDDCVPAPGWVEGLLDALSADPSLGVVQGRTEAPPGSTIGHWTLWRQVRGETPWFEGCNLGFRRAPLLAAGGFDEGIGWYGEDTAAGWGVLAAGYERGYAEGAVVEHDVEERGVGWHLRNARLEANLVGLARRHPDFRRQAFWRAWAFRRENAALAVAVLGLLLAPRRPVGLLLALPYLVVRRSLLHHPGGLRYAMEALAVDAAQTWGHVVGSAKHRIVVL